MCGITGYVDLRRSTPHEALVSTATAMSDRIVHRGPDDAGVWADEVLGVGLGFRRLSIIDLTQAGHQPMIDPSGRYVMVFNGEIYNHVALRDELRGRWDFRGRSDSEVLLAALVCLGVPAALARATGMFAVALLDRARAEIHLARDRFGEKPLYVGRGEGALAFASELKAFDGLPRPPSDIDLGSVASYFRYGYVPEPRSIFAGVEKVPAGSWITVDLASPDRPWRRRSYWSARAETLAAAERPIAGTVQELAEVVDEAVGVAVRERLMSDVPLGAFLSGGIDSSLVVAHLSRAVDGARTFTIGFPEAEWDESGAAAEVSDLLGTDHECLEVSHQEAAAVIPELPGMFDEPFADPSAIPTALVARLAARSVSVVLSGDGGDELFGGYDRYRWAMEVWSRTRRLPRPLRRAAGAVLAGVPIGLWEAGLGAGRAIGVPGLGRVRADHGARVATLLLAEGPGEVYRSLVSHWKDPEALVPGSHEHVTAFDLWGRGERDALDPAAGFMLTDTLTYLPGDILTKVDRTTMAVSIESRVPMLSPELARLAWRLPVDDKVTPREGKPLLRAALRRHLPADVVDRPKMGFGVPLGDWLRGPLRPWAEELLDPDAVRAGGILDPAPVARLWDEHLRGVRDGSYYLWDVLMFQAWQRSHGTARRSERSPRRRLP